MPMIAPGIEYHYALAVQDTQSTVRSDFYFDSHLSLPPFGRSRVDTAF